jgi:uncharacterized protein YjdB
MNYKRAIICLLLFVFCMINIYPANVHALPENMPANQSAMYEKYYRDALRIINELQSKNFITPAIASEMRKHLDQWYEIAKNSNVQDYRDVNTVIDRLLKEQDHLSPGKVDDIKTMLNGSLNLVQVTGVRLDKNSLLLPLGYEETITATVLPSDAVNKEVYWRTEDPRVVGIESQGRSAKVVAKSPGTVKITVTTRDGQYSAYCQVDTVVLVRGLSVEPGRLDLNVGSETELKVEMVPDDASDNSIVWLSTSPAVASVDDSGRVKALKPGETRIIARAVQDESIAAYCQLSVFDESIPLNQNDAANSDKKTMYALIFGGLGLAAIIVAAGLFFTIRANKKDL